MGDREDLERILMGKVEPRDLALQLLLEITENFSKKRKIGEGGFGVVYKGDLQNGIVAVKRIIVSDHTIDDITFRSEVENLMRMKDHRNIVRFLGFCSTGKYKFIEGTISTKGIWAEQRERLLCFDYISNGSLKTHITDELRGLDWRTRYDIINGICRGLHYLHEEKKIIHMDLNPSNIMVDNDMVPKITDFGLSRPNKNTHISGTRFITQTYCAPEYEKHGETSQKADIYSLGVIILELITGRKGLPSKRDDVLRRWRHRWSKEPGSLNYLEHELNECMEIAIRCMKIDPKDRPCIGRILEDLSAIERDKVYIGQEKTYLDDDMLGIEPLELHFTFKPNKEMLYSVKLTNMTKACFAFIIESPCKQYTVRPDKGIVPPECIEYPVQITMHQHERSQQVTQNVDKFKVMSVKVSGDHEVVNITEHMFHVDANKVVDEVDLVVVYEITMPQENSKSRRDTNMPAEEVPEAKRTKIVESISKTENFDSSLEVEATSMDVNSSLQGQCIGQTEQRIGSGGCFGYVQRTNRNSGSIASSMFPQSCELYCRNRLIRGFMAVCLFVCLLALTVNSWSSRVSSLHVPDKLSTATPGKGPVDVVIVYAFDCTESTPAWHTVNDGIFWMVQEKLIHFADSCLGYIYVKSFYNTYTADMKVVDPADTKETGYKKFEWHRLACTKNMSSGLVEAHKMISSCGHHNNIILFFSDGLINKGDFFEGTENFISQVPVHTFTVAGDAYNNVLHAIAANSPGGKFHTTPVPGRPYLSESFSKLLDSLLGGTPKDDEKPPIPNSGIYI